jgi:O-antigen/teichoic acid export membrane protein/O-antigen ligase
MGAVGRMAAAARSRPMAAIVSQGIVAGSSVVLQLVVARSQGDEQLGQLALLLGVLVTLNAVQSGWVGDSLTVLDRHEPRLRKALQRSLASALLVVGIVAFGVAQFVDGLTTRTGVIFAVVMVLWALEETGRRILIARREFWPLALNDTAYAVGALGWLFGWVLAGRDATVDLVLVSMGVGAITAIVAAVVQLPREELRLSRGSESAMREVASFAFWRSLQVGLRPAALAVTRFAVAATASTAALGQLEAARILLAPVLTLMGGIGVYLLPTYTQAIQAGRAPRPPIVRMMVLLALIPLGYAALVLAVEGPIVDLLTNGQFAVTTAAIIGWSLYAGAFGAGIPPAHAVTATGRSRQAFGIRALDNGIGVVAAVAIAWMGAVSWVPVGLAVGGVVGALVLLKASAVRTSPAVDASATALPVVIPPPELLSSSLGAALMSSPADVRPPSVQRPPDGRAARRSPVMRVEPLQFPEFVGDSPGPVAVAPSRAPRWLWVLPLVLIVATEYKLRRRDINDSLSGSVDFGIMIELGLFGLVGLAAASIMVHAKVRWVPLSILMCGYAATTAISAIYAPFPMMALARGVQLVIIALVAITLVSVGDRRTVGWFLDGYTVLMTASIALGIAWVAPVSRVQQGRFTWLYTHSVISGALLAMSVVLLTARVVGRRGSRLLPPLPGFLTHRTRVVLLAVHVVFLLRSQTRASAAAAVIACLVVVWLRVSPRFRPQLVATFLLAVTAAALAAGSVVMAFVQRGEDASRITTLNRRTEIWVLAWESFLRHPLDGRGFTAASGVFYDAVAEGGEKPLGGAHNAYVEVITDVGLIGFIWWAGLIFMTILGISRLHRRNGPTVEVTAMAGLMACLLLNAVTIEGLGAGVSAPAIMLFVTAAWVCISQRAERDGDTSGAPHRPGGSRVQRRPQTGREREVLRV